MAPFDPTRARAIAEAFARAAAVASATGSTSTPAVTSEEIEAAWVATFSVKGTAEGSLTLGWPDADARRLAASKDTAAADEDEVVSCLRHLCAEAMTAIGTQGVVEGLTLALGTVTRLAAANTPAGKPVIYAVENGGSRIRVACWAAIEAAAETSASAADSERSETPGAAAAAAKPPGASPHNLDVILDIDLPLTVRFGQTEMSLLALTKLGSGSLIDLGRSPEAPVDVMVSGKVIARGEVVVVSGNYGVRITEVVSAADRIRSMGA